MKILVALIVPNPLVHKAFAKNQEAFLRPSDISEKLANVQFTVEIIDAKASDQDAQKILLAKSKGYDAVSVILDAAATPKLVEITSGVFVYRIALPKFIDNVQNVVAPMTSRMVRSFSFLLEKFEHSEQFYAAAVPLRNFDAAEARALREIFSNLTLNGNFYNDVFRNISGLLARREPKRDSRYPDQYLIDDAEKYFQFGHEHHSDIETSTPHTTSCELTGRFRFGKRLPEKRHFNVSYAHGRISGPFRDCHDAVNQVPEKSHLNMFSSDFQA